MTIILTRYSICVNYGFEPCRDSLIMSYVRLLSSKGDRYEGMFEYEREGTQGIGIF